MQSGESHSHPDGSEHVGICPCTEGQRNIFFIWIDGKDTDLSCLGRLKSDSKISLPSPARSEKGAHSDRDTGRFLRVLSFQNLAFQKA